MQTVEGNRLLLSSVRLITFPFICEFLPVTNIFFSSQKLLEAHEEQNSDAFTEAVSLCTIKKSSISTKFFWVPLLHWWMCWIPRVLKKVEVSLSLVSVGGIFVSY